jgi:hypothetical protein
VIEGTLPAVLGLAFGMVQASSAGPFSGSRPDPEKLHLAPAHPLCVMAAVGGALATESEY